MLPPQLERVEREGKTFKQQAVQRAVGGYKKMVMALDLYITKHFDLHVPE